MTYGEDDYKLLTIESCWPVDSVNDRLIKNKNKNYEKYCICTRKCYIIANKINIKFYKCLKHLPSKSLDLYYIHSFQYIY